jgi:hypothetical protein
MEVKKRYNLLNLVFIHMYNLMRAHKQKLIYGNSFFSPLSSLCEILRNKKQLKI